MSKEETAIPNDLKQTMLDDPYGDLCFRTYESLLKERIILINGDIKENSVERVIMPLLKMSRERPRRPITMMINSFGGALEEGQAIVDIMQHIETPIITIALGKAMSAAFDVFLAGDFRIVGQNSILMCHAGSEGIGIERLPMINTIADLHKQYYDRWAKFYEARTKLEYKEWYKIIDSGKDRYFFPEEAVEKGIAHEIHLPQPKLKPSASRPKKRTKRNKR